MFNETIIAVLCFASIVFHVGASDQAMIKIRVEGQEYSVSRELAMQCGAIQHMLGDLGEHADDMDVESPVIPLLGVSATTCGLLFGEDGKSGYLAQVWTSRHVSGDSQDGASGLSAEMQRHNLSANTRLDLYQAADYLDIPLLQDACIQQVSAYSNDYWQVQVDDGKQILSYREGLERDAEVPEFLLKTIVHEQQRLQGSAMIQRITGHEGCVCSVAVHPDGSVISGSFDKTIGVIDPRTGTMMQRITGHEDWVYSVAVHPDGSVISGSVDKTIGVTDPRTGTMMQRITGHEDWVRSVAVYSDGSVISGSNDTTIGVTVLNWERYYRHHYQKAEERMIKHLKERHD